MASFAWLDRLDDRPGPVTKWRRVETAMALPFLAVMMAVLVPVGAVWFLLGVGINVVWWIGVEAPSKSAMWAISRVRHHLSKRSR